MSPREARAIALVVLPLLLAPAAALAQQPRGRFSVWINGGAQAAMPSFSDRLTFEMHAEDASVEADYREKEALLVDGGFAARLRGSFAAGVSISRFSGDGRANVVAQIPNPFEFNRFREVTGTASGLTHTELAYHVQLLYARPLTRRLRLVLGAGPTVFDVRRQRVADVQVDEAYPFETATFRRATARAAKGTGVGFNVAADVSWMLGRRAGAGVLVRYARGSAQLKGATGTRSVDTGGLQSGVGLRLYF